MKRAMAVNGLLIMLAASFAFSGAHAQNAEEGRKLAEKHCARCHSLSEGAVSPHREAPPFPAIAAKGKVEDLQEALAEGIVVGHPDMPEFQLEPDQIEDFLAFLRGLASSR